MNNNKKNKKIMYLTLSSVFFVLTIIFFVLNLPSTNRSSDNGIKTNKISTLYIIMLVISILLGGYYLYKFIDENKKDKN